MTRWSKFFLFLIGKWFVTEFFRKSGEGAVTDASVTNEPRNERHVF